MLLNVMYHITKFVTRSDTETVFSHMYFLVAHFYSENPLHLKDQTLCPITASDIRSESETL